MGCSPSIQPETWERSGRLDHSDRILPGFIADGLTLVDLAAAAAAATQERVLRGKVGWIQVKEANPGEVGLDWTLRGSMLLPWTSAGMDGTFDFFSQPTRVFL